MLDIIVNTPRSIILCILNSFIKHIFKQLNFHFQLLWFPPRQTKHLLTSNNGYYIWPYCSEVTCTNNNNNFSKWKNWKIIYCPYKILRNLTSKLQTKPREGWSEVRDLAWEVTVTGIYYSGQSAVSHCLVTWSTLKIINHSLCLWHSVLPAMEQVLQREVVEESELLERKEYQLSQEH